MTIHILNVDDDETTLNVLCDLFTDEGYVVGRAANGRDALAAMKAHDFDVLLTDLSMPVMDGRELVRTLRFQKRFLPVVVMTASSNVVEAARSIDAQAHISKPLDINRLVDTVERVVRENVKLDENAGPGPGSGAFYARPDGSPPQKFQTTYWG